MNKLREQIDEIDDKIGILLEKRTFLVKNLIQQKKEEGIPIEDTEREQRIINRISESTSLHKKFIEDLYTVIFNHNKQCLK